MGEHVIIRNLFVIFPFLFLYFIRIIIKLNIFSILKLYFLCKTHFIYDLKTSNQTIYHKFATTYSVSIDSPTKIEYTSKERRCASLQIDIEIDPAVEDTKVLIMTKEKNQFINDLVDVLSNYSKKKITSLTAYINDKVYFIDVAEILRIYTANQKVYTDKRGGIPNKI